MARLATFRLLAAFLAAAITVGSIVPTALAAPARSELVRLDGLGRTYGLKVTVSRDGRQVQWRGRSLSFDFTAGSREVSWNGHRLFLGEAVKISGKSLVLSPTDWRAIIRPLLDPGAGPRAPALQRIAIDPGHGGADPGTENRRLKLQEKAFTLDVARRLKRDLERRGYIVILTRETDTKLKPGQEDDLQARAAKATRAGADLFISIHFNSLPSSPNVRGVETYAFTPAGQRSTAATRSSTSDRISHPGNQYDHWNSVLSGVVHHRLRAGLGATDRGIKRARFVVLREVRCPAVLIEGGFLSHTGEARQIASASYRQKLAEAIGAGVGDYAALTKAKPLVAP